MRGSGLLNPSGWRGISIGLFVLFSCGVALGSPETPFGFLEPSIHFSASDKGNLDNRQVVVRILPASGHELAVLAAGSLAITPDAFVAAVRHTPDLLRSKMIPELGRFSSEPRVSDLEQLTLDPADVSAIKECQPDHCGLELTADEINRLHAADREPGVGVDQEFRRIVLERTKAYLAHGDQTTEREFTTLLQHSPYVQSKLPQLGRYIAAFPKGRVPGVESFVYWSKANYAWKPIVSATLVMIRRNRRESGLPEVVVASRDIFSTRYTSGSFGLTMLFADADVPTRHYLVYISRTWVNGLHALWRPFVDFRVRKQSGRVFDEFRARLEAGDRPRLHP